jgi:hypothetical protein
MKDQHQETVDLIQSIESLMRCLSHRNLQNTKVKTALRHFKKSAGFKKVIGELSSVHVLNVGTADASEGAQRFRQLDYDSDDMVHYEREEFGSAYSSPRSDLIILNEKFVLQTCKDGKWVDAQASDLQVGV